MKQGGRLLFYLNSQISKLGEEKGTERKENTIFSIKKNIFEFLRIFEFTVNNLSLH